MSYRLGVDVGGTFTDLLLVDEDTGRTWRAKTPSTPADQSEGVMSGLAKVCAEAGIAPSGSAQVLHGTTGRAGPRAGGAARRPGVDLPRGAAGDAGVRAHADHGRQQLRAAAGLLLPRQPRRAARRGGVAGPLYVLRSDGGLASARVATGNPVSLLLSGPAGGVTGAAWAAEQAGFRGFEQAIADGTRPPLGDC